MIEAIKETLTKAITEAIQAMPEENLKSLTKSPLEDFKKVNND